MEYILGGGHSNDHGDEHVFPESDTLLESGLLYHGELGVGEEDQKQNGKTNAADLSSCADHIAQHITHQRA